MCIRDRCYTADSLVALTSSQETTCLYRQIVNPYSGGVIGTIVLQLDSRRLFGELHIEGLKEYAFIMQDGDGVNLYTCLLYTSLPARKRWKSCAACPYIFC